MRRLRGQFAYAIHDSPTGDTHLFRDRLGILPLYYYADTRLFAFASEIKALLEVINMPSVRTVSMITWLIERSRVRTP